MAQTIPVQAVPNQTLSLTLNDQAVTLNIYQKSSGLYMDVLVNNTDVIVGGVICQNLNRIVRDLYLGFTGDFSWFDNQGNSDPEYTGIGDRWTLLYLEPADLPPGAG